MWPDIGIIVSVVVVAGGGMFKILADRIDKKQDKEMAETIRKGFADDLKKVNEKFKVIEGKLDRHTEVLSSINTSLAVMAKAMEKS